MSPVLDQGVCLQQRIEELAVEELRPALPIERFDITVLPRTSGLDEQEVLGSTGAERGNQASRRGSCAKDSKKTTFAFTGNAGVVGAWEHAITEASP
jgi:hypothetical protein